VCGQEVVNAAFDEQMLDMLYREAESVMKEADGHYAALNAEKDALNAQIAAFTAQYEAALKAHEEDRSLADAASAFAVSCAECGLDPDSHDIISAIASQKDSADKVLGGLMEKIRQGEVMEGELREAAKLLDECWNGFRKAEESVANAERDRKECGIRIETGRKMVEDRLNDISEAEKSVSAYVVLHQEKRTHSFLHKKLGCEHPCKYGTLQGSRP
jgi:chromosome segregation ATPase